MAFMTTGLVHTVGMRHVAVAAGLDMAMIIMAGGTGQQGMDAGIPLQLLILDAVAGETGPGNFLGKAYLQGSMRVNMTGKTAADGKMLLSFVTGGAGRHDVKVGGRMALVAVKAKRGVGLALGPQTANYLLMAFTAVIPAYRGTDLGVPRLYVVDSYKQQNEETIRPFHEVLVIHFNY